MPEKINLKIQVLALKNKESNNTCRITQIAIFPFLPLLT